MPARNIPVTWQMPDDLRAEYATHVIAQRGEHEVHLLFFLAQPPLIAGEPAEREKQLQEIVSVPAKGVAKLIVAADKLDEIIKMLQEIRAQYKAIEQLAEEKS
jgi:hypothetical protein